MAKFVFFNAEQAGIKLSIKQQHIGWADSASDLAALLRANDVTLADRLMHSSDVDFASEEGFATDDDAHKMIEEALALL